MPSAARLDLIYSKPDVRERYLSGYGEEEKTWQRIKEIIMRSLAFRRMRTTLP